MFNVELPPADNIRSHKKKKKKKKKTYKKIPIAWIEEREERAVLL